MAISQELAVSNGLSFACLAAGHRLVRSDHEEGVSSASAVQRRQAMANDID